MPAATDLRGGEATGGFLIGRAASPAATRPLPLRDITATSFYNIQEEWIYVVDERTPPTRSMRSSNSHAETEEKLSKPIDQIERTVRKNNLKKEEEEEASNKRRAVQRKTLMSMR